MRLSPAGFPAPCAIAAWLALSVPLPAAVSVDFPVASHALLQRDAEIPLRGAAEPGEKVDITLGPDMASAQAGPDGRWKAVLSPLKASGPYTLTVQGASGTAKIDDLLVGDLWLCAGQSNMELPVMKAAHSDEELAQATHPRIRLLDVPNHVADTPQAASEGSWSICGPESVAHFTAVGYFFGREMEKTLDVPIGLIDVSWGGTTIESWVPREALEADADLRAALDTYAQKAAAFPQALADYQAKLPEILHAWEDACAAAQAAGKPLPPKPQPPILDPRLLPAGIYNQKIAPLSAFPLCGVLWYQGESNVGRSGQYRQLLAALIGDWRRLWGRKDLPFLIVQLPNYGEPRVYSEPSRWSELRDAQSKAGGLPHVSVVPIIDLGEEKNVHPLDKQSVGHRLAQAALHDVFGRQEAAVAPVFNGVQFGDGVAMIAFDRAEGLRTRDGGPVTGFAVAGKDRKFIPVPGAIRDEGVVLDTKAVSSPEAVRYDWADNPLGNLTNKAGLPVGTFRSDDWSFSGSGK